MKILVTAFDAFGGEEVNASGEILSRLQAPADSILVRQILPTQFIKGPEVLYARLAEEDPDILLLLGQAGGRSAVTPERIAINCMDARIPDNVGYAPCDIPVDPDGPDAYLTDFPVRAAVEHLKAAGFPVAVSNTAGTFVCNCLFYKAMQYVRTRTAHRVLCDFVHIPYLTGQPHAENLPELAPDVCAATVQTLLDWAAQYYSETAKERS